MNAFKPEDLIKIATMQMPFGKYKGRVLIDLPEVYVIWFHNQVQSSSSELHRLLAQLYEIKVNGLEYLFAPLRDQKMPLAPKPSKVSKSLLKFPRQHE